MMEDSDSPEKACKADQSCTREPLSAFKVPVAKPTSLPMHQGQAVAQLGGF